MGFKESKKENLKKNIPIWKKKRILFFFLVDFLFLIFFLFDYIFPFNPQKPYSQIIYGKDSVLISAKLSYDGYWRLKTTESEIPQNFKKLILEKEDRYFYSHFGCNPFSLLTAAFGNIIHLKRQSGASTITMQVVRLCKKRNRNVLSKFFEIINSYQLELNYTKDEIFEMYLSYIPFGGNVEGLKACSYLFFQKAPGNLSLGEISALLLIPNRPITYSLNSQKQDLLLKARSKWLNRFLKQGDISQNQFDVAINEPFAPNRKQIVNKAPHFSRFVLENKSNHQSDFLTNLDLKIQFIVGEKLKHHIEALKPIGITNGAVLMIENASGKIISYHGSADFNDVESEGQNDAIQAWRSPGSTLKTFLYANAIEMGEVTPSTILYDCPIIKDGFIPENFDKKFRGKVSLQYALINSLNIPAIEMADYVPIKDFIYFLGEKLRFKKIDEKKRKLGISIILGGCEANLYELTQNYQIFGNLGIKVPIQITVPELNSLKSSGGEKERIYSKETAWIMMNMLGQNNRPELHFENSSYNKNPKIAWKTGTSFGKKDAWVIGITKKYTIGIWIGNMNGRSAAALTGANTAVPLLFDVINALPKEDGIFEKPQNIRENSVCKQSGMPMGRFCNEKMLGIFIKGRSKNSVCNAHKEYFISKDNRFHYCVYCKPEQGFLRKSFQIYKTSYLSWLQSEGKYIDEIPPHFPECEVVSSNEEIKITSPSEGFKYIFERDAKSFLILKAITPNDASFIHWYANNQYLGRFACKEGVKFQPLEGKNEIKCLDSKGRKSSLMVEVEMF